MAEVKRSVKGKGNTYKHTNSHTFTHVYTTLTLSRQRKQTDNWKRNEEDIL